MTICNQVRRISMKWMPECDKNIESFVNKLVFPLLIVGMQRSGERRNGNMHPVDVDVIVVVIVVIIVVVIVVVGYYSGTHYSWEMLNRLGIRVHHEGVGPDGAVGWPFAIK